VPKCRQGCFAGIFADCDFFADFYFFADCFAGFFVSLEPLLTRDIVQGRAAAQGMGVFTRAEALSCSEIPIL
jgi:hypothetical protein